MDIEDNDSNTDNMDLYEMPSEELQKMIIPAISAETEDYSALVTVTSKGYTITDAGMNELAKRNLLA
jgi:hypothetical protein